MLEQPHTQHERWFFGGGDLPRWAGYTLGARVVASFLERHPAETAAALVGEPATRTHPIDGVTYVVSGGGCKTTPVGRSRFTAVAESTLQFLLFDIAGDRLVGTCIRADGDVVDRFSLAAREGRSR